MPHVRYADEAFIDFNYRANHLRPLLDADTILFLAASSDNRPAN